MIGDSLSRSESTVLSVIVRETRESEFAKPAKGEEKNNLRNLEKRNAINLTRKKKKLGLPSKFFFPTKRFTIMGSSNKSRKHYKKDSRFVADLYTFTYDDDLDCVRDM